MTKKIGNLRLRKYLLNYLRSQKAGFSLAELLVASVIGSIVTMGVLILSNKLLETDKTEKDKSRGQENVAQVMDYITAELKQAEFIYDGDCIGNGRSRVCPGLANAVNIPAGQTPVLAFWKSDDLTSRGELPAITLQDGKLICDGLPEARAGECKGIKNSLRSYILVIYSLKADTDSTDVWKGPAQIVRSELPIYKKDGLATLEITEEYPKNSDGTPIAPMSTAVNFASWPCTTADMTANTCSIATQAPYNDPQVLADLVDYPNEKPDAEQCPDQKDSNNQYVYSPSPKKDDTTPANNSFYACVRVPREIKQAIDSANPAPSPSPNVTPAPDRFQQDVIVFLRMNTTEQAGQDKDNMAYRPSMRRQVTSRTVINEGS